MTRFRHGDAYSGRVTRLHNIWRGMLKRCDATSGEAFEKYAARGILVTPEWRRYETFKAWALANGYSNTLTIERDDNDGNYEPCNCRWVTLAAQARNRRTTHYVEAHGERLSVAEWAERTGLNKSTIAWRSRQGWPAERVLAA